MWPDVEFFKLNREPADVDQVSVVREVAEDRGPFCGCGDGRRAASSTCACDQACLREYVTRSLCVRWRRWSSADNQDHPGKSC